MIRVALDAMGGDHAPAAPVQGAVQALASLGDDVVIQLVGRTAAIEAELANHSVPPGRIEMVEAPEVVGMAERPVEAIRGKRQSSIVVGIGLQREAQSDAFISAGNTGAVMAAATMILRLYPGFARAAIGAPFPTADHPILIVDAGASVDCSAAELAGFARLGVLYARDVLGRDDPGVGLLNIGEETEKGNAAAKEAHRLLAESGLRFVGNVEGRDILSGRTPHGGPFDVVVCDGFVGNVLLKFYESVAQLFYTMVAREVDHELAHSQGFRRIWTHLDYQRFGGAPLLGVRGACIICHGRSTPEALASAVRVAVDAARHHLVQHMTSAFAAEAGAA
jgi:glycerol-3-phosphate acyltransferase PlsX